MSESEEINKLTGEMDDTSPNLTESGKTDLTKVGTDPTIAKNADEERKKAQDKGMDTIGLGKKDEMNPDTSALPDPEYITNFCKNKNTPQNKGVSDIVNGLENVLNMPEHIKNSIGTVMLGIFLVLYLIWTLMKYSDLLAPFAGGAFNILKFILIYTCVIVLLVFFFKFTSLFGFWYVHFVKFFSLMLNPLLDKNVSFLFCYLTDYVNWIIYFPAMFVYALCVIGMLLFLFLIIIPVLAIVSFIIAFLFSLIGEPGQKSESTSGSPGVPGNMSFMSKIGKTASAMMGTTASAVMGRTAAGMMGNAASGMMGSASGMMGKAASGMTGKTAAAFASLIPGVGSYIK